MIAIALGACSASDGGADGPSASPPGATPPAGSGDVNLPARVLDPIVADAAARAAVDPAAVTIVSAEPRTWGDSSLGCPRPGMYYTQVQVDGYQVIVSAGGVEYDYRAGSGGRFIVCEGAKPSF